MTARTINGEVCQNSSITCYLSSGQNIHDERNICVREETDCCLTQMSQGQKVSDYHKDVWTSKGS